jgi:hypothetical protein
MLKGAQDAGETDTGFLHRKSMSLCIKAGLADTLIPLEIEVARIGLDRGLHIGKWGQLQGAHPGVLIKYAMLRARPSTSFQNGKWTWTPQRIRIVI